jgi:hypothetical protein
VVTEALANDPSYGIREIPLMLGPQFQTNDYLIANYHTSAAGCSARPFRGPSPSQRRRLLRHQGLAFEHPAPEAMLMILP